MVWKRAVFALFTVVLFFGALELALWAAGVPTLLSEQDPFRGFSGRIGVYELDAERGVLRTPTRAVRHSFNYQEFRAVKPTDGLRVFVLGGSSAYGFPWGADVAFPRALRAGLQATYPERTVEVVNAAAMSYGSHRLRVLAREVLQYEPDLIVVYGGHNEFVERRFYRDMLERRRELDVLRGVLARWRLYSALRRAFERSARRPPSSDEPDSTGAMLGLDVVREYSVGVDRDEVEHVRQDFETNLRALLEAAREVGVPVVLCTVPSNIRGWKPNQSRFGDAVGPAEQRQVEQLLAAGETALETRDGPRAVELLERASRIAPEHSGVRFLLGRAYASQQRWDDAHESYVAARDLDGQPSRAMTALNDTIRELAREPGATVVDVERELEAFADHGIPGFDLIEDYVHPTPRAHRLIACEIWQVVVRRGLVGAAYEVDRSGCDAWLAPPTEPGAAASAQSGSGQRNLNALFNVALVLENQGNIEEAKRKYRECLEIEPRYYVARLNLGRLLHREGAHRQAAAEYATALRDAAGTIHHARTLVGLGEALVALGRAEDALPHLESATRIDDASDAAWSSLGNARARIGDHAGAERAYRRAIELEPDEAASHANLGFALLMQARLDAAEGVFRDALERWPEHPRSGNGLAAVLTERGAYDAAERIFERNLARDPGDAFARGGLQEVRRRRGS